MGQSLWVVSALSFLGVGAASATAASDEGLRLTKDECSALKAVVGKPDRTTRQNRVLFAPQTRGFAKFRYPSANRTEPFAFAAISDPRTVYERLAVKKLSARETASRMPTSNPQVFEGKIDGAYQKISFDLQLDVRPCLGSTVNYVAATGSSSAQSGSQAVLVSPVAIDAKKSYALIVVYRPCGVSCGYEELYVAHKARGKWLLGGNQLLSIS